MSCLMVMAELYILLDSIMKDTLKMIISMGMAGKYIPVVKSNKAFGPMGRLSQVDQWTF